MYQFAVCIAKNSLQNFTLEHSRTLLNIRLMKQQSHRRWDVSCRILFYRKRVLKQSCTLCVLNRWSKPLRNPKNISNGPKLRHFIALQHSFLSQTREHVLLCRPAIHSNQICSSFFRSEQSSCVSTFYKSQTMACYWCSWAIELYILQSHDDVNKEKDLFVVNIWVIFD